MTKQEILELLTTTKKETLLHFDMQVNSLDKTYGEGKWSVRQILHHLTDSEMIFHERLKRVIAEPWRVIWAYDQDKWNYAFDYLHDPLKNKKAVFEICRNMNCQLVEKYHDGFHDRTFVHSEAGLRTLGSEFERIGSHNQNHLRQIQLALSK